MLEIKLGRLKHDIGYCLPLDFSAACDPVAYGYEELSLAGPLVFSGQAQNKGGEIVVEGELKASLALVCSRCGEPFELPLALPLAEIYSPREQIPDAEGEWDKRSFSGGAIDLTPEALRVLYAELPMKPLCKENCRGLCPICGADLNHENCSCEKGYTDPRWEKLSALLQDERSVEHGSTKGKDLQGQ